MQIRDRSLLVYYDCSHCTALSYILHLLFRRPEERNFSDGYTWNLSRAIKYEIIGEGSQICRYCLRRKGHKSQLLAGEGSQISLF